MTAPARGAHDLLVMGTGPPALIYGLERSELGERVLFVDDNTRPGGSWRTLPAFGYEQVEPGVHYFECRPYTRPMLENLLGPDGLSPSDGDFALFGRRRVPMRYARPVLYGLVAGKAAIRGKGERTLHSLRHTLAATANMTTEAVYPRGGAAALVGTLMERLKAAGASFEFGHRIAGIEIGSAGIDARTEGAGRFGAHRLLMSSRAHAPIAGLEHLWDGLETKSVWSYVLELESSDPKFDGYVEFIGHPGIKRVRNTGMLLGQGPRPGRAVVTLQLRCRAESEAQLEEAVSTMRKLGLLDQSARLLHSCADEMLLTTLPENALRTIERANPGQVTALRTVDMSDRRHRISPVEGPA